MGFLTDVLEGREQLGAERAVDDAMIAGQASPSSCWRRRRCRPACSTACRRAAPTARMVPCGGLMIAENSRTPYMPRLEIALDAALILVRQKLAGAGARGKLAHLGRDRFQ